MTEFQTDKMNNNNRPLKGLQDNGMVNFTCQDCGQQLLVLQLTAVGKDAKSNVLTRVVVRCRDCGGCSYVQQISGQFYPGAPGDNMAFDISENIDGVPEHDVLFEAWSK